MKAPVASLAALCLSATCAAAIEVPDCAALAAWGAAGGADHPLNAEIALPAAYAPEASAAVFGLAFLDWTKPDIDAVDAALNRCRGEANSARDRAAADGFAGQRRDLNRMARVLRDVATGRENAARAMAAIEAGPQTPQLVEGLMALATLDPAEIRGFRTNLRDLGALARATGALPVAEQAAIQGSLGALAGAASAGIVGARLAALAEVPVTAEGILALRLAAFGARDDLGADAGPVLAAAATREAEIAAELAALPQPPIALPECGVLLGWGASIDPEATRRTPAGPIMVALEAPELEALFGKGFADWAVEDVGLFAALVQQCREAARAGWLEGDARELDGMARRLTVLGARAADQPARFAALAEARALADQLIGEAQAAPLDAQGLGMLQAVLAQAGGQMAPADAEAVRAAVAAQRETVVAAVLGEYLAPMAAAPASLAGLDAIRGSFVAAASSPIWWQLDDAERGRLRAAAEEALAQRASGALPEFEERLAALPATFDGLQELDTLVEQALLDEGPAWAGYHEAVAARRAAIVPGAIEAGLPELEAAWASVPATPEGYAGLLAQTFEIAFMAETRHPAFGQVAERSAARAAAVRASMLDARCAPVLAEAGLGRGDGGMLVLAGGEPVALGAFLCDLAGRVDGVPAYEAPGFFGSEHRLTMMLPQGWQGVFVLREAEVRPGVEALVGIRAEEPTGSRDLTTAEWNEAAGWLTGAGACAYQAEVAAAEPISADWLELSHCLLANPVAAAPVPLPTTEDAARR